MTVYVDDMYKLPLGKFRGMKMSHMIADTEDELHAMARRIGVARRWFQDPKTMPKVSHPHYDICMSKRELAIRFGAKAVTLQELPEIIARRDGKTQERLL